MSLLHRLLRLGRWRDDLPLTNRALILFSRRLRRANVSAMSGTQASAGPLRAALASLRQANHGSQQIAVAVLCAALGLAGCESLSSLFRLSGPSKDFVAAATAISQAESDYFDEIQAASDAAYRLQAAETYVGHKSTFQAFVEELNKHDDFSKAKALRLVAMRQLKNYAQQVSAITTGGSPTWIADDAKSAMTNIDTLVKDAGDKTQAKLLTSNAGAIQTAVTDLGRAIINHESAAELQGLAQEAKGPIAQIADMVKQDNINIETDNFSTSLQADQTQALHDILHFIYDDPKVNTFERFNAMQITINWKPSLVTKGKAILSALDKLQAANDALAKKEDASLASLAQDAYSLAKQATEAPKPTTETPKPTTPAAK